MRSCEYESKALFAKRGMPLGRGKVARGAAESSAAAREIAGAV